MNLERVFLPITLVISIAILLLGIGLVGREGWRRLERWDEAGEPVPHSWVRMMDNRLEQRRAYSPIPRRYRPGPTPIWGEGILVHVAESHSSDEWFGRYASEMFIQSTLDQRSAVGDLRRNFDIDTLGTDRVAFIYFPASEGNPSALYSRKAILHAEASGHLTRTQQEVLTKARKDYRFPYPVSPPFTLREWIASVSIAVCIAAVPWVFFFLIHWLARPKRDV